MHLEKWTEIKYPIDYKGLYLVSNTGRPSFCG